MTQVRGAETKSLPSPSPACQLSVPKWKITTNPKTRRETTANKTESRRQVVAVLDNCQLFKASRLIRRLQINCAQKPVPAPKKMNKKRGAAAAAAAATILARPKGKQILHTKCQASKQALGVCKVLSSFCFCFFFFVPSSGRKAALCILTRTLAAKSINKQ